MVPTRDHDLIRRWAKLRDAIPAEIKLLKFDSEPAILTFLLGAAKVGTPELRPISWGSFFAQFELLELALAYDDNSPQFNLVHLEKPSVQPDLPLMN